MIKDSCVPGIKVEYTQSLDYVYYSIFLNVLTAEKPLIQGTVKLNQHICLKGFLTSKYKDMLLWKTGSSFVYTEDENLCNIFRLIWFDKPRPSERSP